MRLPVMLVCCVAFVACKKEQPVAAAPKPVVPALAPAEVNVDGAYHAISCGGVTAVWSGDPEMLTQHSVTAPKSYGVESLAFRFADGSTKGFAPTGQLFFSDWTFAIFAPDCSTVALQIDHYGPFHVVRVDELRGYLEGRTKALQVQALHEKDALVHSDLRWVSPVAFEFVASCCGGAQVFRAATKDGSLERVFDAPAAPKGVRRGKAGWEVVP